MNKHERFGGNIESSEQSFEDPEQLHIKNQCRKVLLACAFGAEGKVDSSQIVKTDKEIEKEGPIDDEAMDALLGAWANGEIGTNAQRRDMMTRIIGPLHEPSGDWRTSAEADQIREGLCAQAREIVGQLDRQPKRILSNFSPTGFEHAQNVGGADLRFFLRKFPTPMDFEEPGAKFLDNIRRANSPEKAAEYERAMESFQSSVYGRKYEYWKRIKEIDAAAANYLAEKMEKERSSEWEPGSVGIWQTSRRQAAGDYVSRENIDRGMYADASCEDAVFVNPNTKVYAVFDGAGGSANGRLAAEIARQELEKYDAWDNVNPKYYTSTAGSLVNVLDGINRKLLDTSEAKGAFTTGTIASVVERNGQKVLAYATVGDSRLYVVKKDGSAELLTEDEGEGRYIKNGLGMRADRYKGCCEQFSEYQITSKDLCFVLCSDGITGDKGDELMSEKELGQIVRLSKNTDDAAKNLIARSRKIDDKSAIVFTA